MTSNLVIKTHTHTHLPRKRWLYTEEKIVLYDNNIIFILQTDDSHRSDLRDFFKVVLHLHVQLIHNTYLGDTIIIIRPIAGRAYAYSAFNIKHTSTPLHKYKNRAPLEIRTAYIFTYIIYARLSYKLFDKIMITRCV